MVMVCNGFFAVAKAADITHQPSAVIAHDGYQLVKEWIFTGSGTTPERIDADFFKTYTYPSGTLDHLNDEWERYRDHNNIVLGTDRLGLVARVTGGLAPGHIESGMLQSKWSGEYGYFEARLKVPGGRGLWPAFWLTPADGGWPPEIDVMEVVNNDRDGTRASFHFLHEPGQERSSTISSLLDSSGRYWPGVDYAGAFHTFAVEWTPTAVRHYVDGTLVVARQFQWRRKDGSDAGAARLVLNLAVGSSWPGNPVTPADFPAALEVQFIRIWQK